MRQTLFYFVLAGIITVFISSPVYSLDKPQADTAGLQFTDIPTDEHTVTVADKAPVVRRSTPVVNTVKE